MKIFVVFLLCLSASLAQIIPSYFIIPSGIGTPAPTTVQTTEVTEASTAAAAAGRITTEEPMLGACTAPYDGEATSFLTNVAEVLLDTMAKDRYSRGAIGYLASYHFQRNLALLQSTSEYQFLQDFACRDMFIDVDFFFTWLIQRASAPPPPRKYPGLPWGGFEKLVDLSQFTPSLMYTFAGTTPDRILSSLYMSYKSPTFEKIVDYVMNNQAYKRIEEQLDVFKVELPKIAKFYEEILYQFSQYRGSYFRQQRLKNQPNPQNQPKQQNQQNPKV